MNKLDSPAPDDPYARRVTEREFRKRVEAVMAQLPDDKVTTYGDVAAMAGHPRAARIVGGIAHTGLTTLPWHRLVSAKGELAVGYPGGRDAQQQLLACDGIKCDEQRRVKDFAQRRWRPEW